MSDNAKPLDPAQMQALARIRRFMMIASVTTFVAIAVVFGVIGYKVYKSGDTAPAAETRLNEFVMALPAGTKVISTAINGDRILVTTETGGLVELRTFDAKTMKPLGRLGLDPRS